MESGKKRRLRRIFQIDNKTVIVPMDHGVTMGPVKGLLNMESIINKLLVGGADAIVINRGIAKKVNTRNAGLIVHLSGATIHCPTPNNKLQISSVDDAIRLGADAVSVHVNIGSEHESQMLSMLGKVACECDNYGMPLLAMMYPRGPRIKDSHSADIVAHAARLGAELGADIIKTNYTGNVESFKAVVSCCNIPVIIAGGVKMQTSRDLLQIVKDTMIAGGAGISIGRNVFQHEDPEKIVQALVTIVHRGASVDDALEILGEST